MPGRGHSPLVSLALTALAIVASTPRGADATPRNARPAFAPGELLVSLRAGPARARARDVLADHGIRTREPLPAGLARVTLPLGTRVRAAAERVARLPGVRYAEPNWYRYPHDTIPDDPLFPQQWSVHNTGQVVRGTPGLLDADVDAPEAWDTVWR